MSIWLVKYAKSLSGHITKQINSAFMLTAESFPMVFDHWALALAAAAPTVLEHPAVWYPREKVEAWKLGTDFFKKKFKKKIFLHLGERQVCESMPDSVVLKTGRKLKQSLLCVLWPLIFFSLHYQIFAAPGFCQLYVIPRQKVLPKDLLEGRGRKKRVFFNLMSMMSSL